MLKRLMAATVAAAALTAPALAQQEQPRQPDQLEGRAPSARPVFPDEPAAQAPPAGNQQQQAQGERQFGAEEMPMDQLALAQADSIKGSAVLNASGERIGDIQDIVLDVKQGSAEFAVVGVGGFLGVGEKNVAVPWDRLRPADRPQSFVLDVDRQTLEQAPAIDLENVAEMQKQDVRDRISSFWRDVPQQAQAPR
ncbi:MAG: PRC-barrel domain-containing protein [Pseudomonadota bacterium]